MMNEENERLEGKIKTFLQTDLSVSSNTRGETFFHNKVMSHRPYIKEGDGLVIIETNEGLRNQSPYHRC